MLVRPRLNDHYNLPLRQEDVDFAIPFLDEDIPLYLDPFLLWKSPSQMDNSLHSTITNAFNRLGGLYLKEEDKAVEILTKLSECDEVGLGTSKTRQGKKIGTGFASTILSAFTKVPKIREEGLAHFEVLQLLVDGFSKDRVSDFACNFIKSFLIDYTIQQSEKYEIPSDMLTVEYLDTKKFKLVSTQVPLPVNPIRKEPILLVPKRWLRYMPWINFDDYFSSYIEESEKLMDGRSIGRVEILEYNRSNFGQVEAYVKRKQLEQKDCKNDPLFSQIPIISSKKKKNAIMKLPTGLENSADKEYENNLCPLLASMLYPEMDFAQTQSRTDSGVLIRDLIFYNNVAHNLLQELYELYGSKQIVFELKNVKQLETEHINQLNRYLTDEFGSFGVIFTRNIPPKNVFRNTIDLWAGQRRCIIVLDDTDLKLMCEVFENKQRAPIDVLNKKYREFLRACPS